MIEKPHLPDTMNAIHVEDTKLVMRPTPLPPLKKGEVLIKVEAAGINRPDVLQRLGKYNPPADASPLLGLEVAGRVIIGNKHLKAGTEVCALTNGGGYAEYCAVPHGQCLPIPKKLGMIAASGIPETFFTVWFNVIQRAQLQKNESILIHGGASGIGTTAIQIAKIMGARVFTTAGTDHKKDACLKLGADVAINYNTDNFADIIKKKTKKEGVNVVLDMVGGDYVARNLSCMAHDGRHISIGIQKGRTADVDLFRIMSKQITLMGSTLRPQSTQVKTDIAKDIKRHLWSYVIKNRLGPVVDRIFPLAQAHEAHEYLDSGQHIGKVILKV